MPNIFFTSDLHFSHANIARFCPQFRSQAGTDALNEQLVRVWNDTVSPDDIVYNLGDLSFARDVQTVSRHLKRLNGEHHLVFGNHDGIIRAHLDHFLNTPKHDGRPLLASAQDVLKIKMPDSGQTAVLFHYPICEWEGCHKGWYHLYGHLHDRLAPLKGRALNVGYDLHGRLLAAEDVERFLAALPKTDHHGEKKTMPDTVDAAREYVARSLKQLNA